ncbi:hypothetical protein [Negadavirga shengliensis]|uniref:JAB domain-containing protein n=1 Tax=Negadavirga shengliensis TaxID=1389218 RepID=A0ABV9T6E2_9BACT
MEGWLNFFRFFEHQSVTPVDDLIYSVHSGVIKITDLVLKQYGQLPHEGLVFWAGNISENIFNITHVIAPETESSEGRVTVPHSSIYHVVKALSNNKVIHIGQIHTHPGNWVDHSRGDDEWAPFKRPGLISLVVPNYCSSGMLPLKKNGIHRYQENQFIGLSNKYIRRHFIVVEGEAHFTDLRDKENIRWKQLSGTD